MDKAAQHIRSGKGMVPKKVHFWVMGIFLVIVGVTLAFWGNKRDASRADFVKAKQEQENKNAAAAKPNPSVFEAQVEATTKQAEKEAAQAQATPQQPAPNQTPTAPQAGGNTAQTPGQSHSQAQPAGASQAGAQGQASNTQGPNSKRPGMPDIGGGVGYQENGPIIPDEERKNAAISTGAMVVLSGGQKQNGAKREGAAGQDSNMTAEEKAIQRQLAAMESGAYQNQGGHQGGGDDLASIAKIINGENQRQAVQTRAEAQNQWADSQTKKGSTSMAGPAAGDVRQGNYIVDAPALAPYAIHKGKNIPAVLVSPITSDLPGQITAQVTQDVYDDVVSRFLIIPMGSRVVGTYNNQIDIGQERIQVAFDTIYLPDGRSINISGMPGADAQGYAGIKGEVDNHFVKMFGASFMVAVLASWADRGQKQPATTIVTGGSGGTSSAAGTVLVDISKRILDRNTNIPPTILVPGGTKFNIRVTKEMVIRPWARVR